MTANAFGEESVNPGPLQVSKLTCEAVIAAILVPADCDVPNGLVGTVNVPVYTARPLTIRTLEINPFVQFSYTSTYALLPICNVPELVIAVAYVAVPIETPSTYKVIVEPLRTTAK